MILSNILLVVMVLLVGLHVCHSCDLDQTRHGCRIQNGMCSCGVGCIADYRYTSRRECQAALKGRRKDICFVKPCLNGGSCIQVTQHPGFKCRCEGTGFYGSSCEAACPKGVLANGAPYPYECIVI